MWADNYEQTKFAGAHWLKAAEVEMSEFGEKVADLLGQLELGIYHIQKEVMHDRVDWSSDYYIEIVLSGSLSTFDNARLTTLVLLCHHAAIRCEIHGAAPNYLRLVFYPRERDDTGSMPIHIRHPSIDKAIKTFNYWNGWHPNAEQEA
jgi:hypothetical protein